MLKTYKIEIKLTDEQKSTKTLDIFTNFYKFILTVPILLFNFIILLICLS